MVDAKPNASVRKVTLEKAEACQCLLCDAAAHKRGLCVVHYQRYRTARAELPIEQRPLFDAKLQRTGKLLASRQGQRLDIVNEFRRS
jgi:hypothetical protein